MLREVPRYKAACTYVTGSQMPEVKLLIRWLDVPMADLVAIFPDRRAQLDTPVGMALEKSGARLYSVKDHGWDHNAAVLGLWLDDSQLTRVEDSRPTKVGVAAWTPHQIDIWRLARDPVELAGVELPTRNELDPVVTAAMDDVANMSNPANGLTSYNRTGAVDAFRILRKHGYTWDPVETAVVVARGGWDLDDARKFAELSADMLAGKSLRGGGELSDNSIHRWREASPGR